MVIGLLQYDKGMVHKRIIKIDERGTVQLVVVKHKHINKKIIFEGASIVLY